MAEATLDFDAQSKRYIEGVLRRLDPKDTFRVADQLFKVLAPRAARFVAKTQLNNQNLRRRSGNLFREIEGRAIRDSGIPAIQVGVFAGATSLPYAGVQE